MNLTNSKLISLLDSFSEKDIKGFRKFISSDFFSGGRNYLIILNHLLKFKKKGLDKITPQILHSKLYAKKQYSIPTLNNRFSELFKLVA